MNNMRHSSLFGTFCFGILSDFVIRHSSFGIVKI